LKPGYGDQEKIAKYQGRFRPFELRPGYGEQQNIGRYKGNIRARKPLKGGGSISGKFWNNDSRPIAVREPGSDTRVATNFRGTLKFRKPLKGGGGSISGRMWNNDEQPLQRSGTSKTSLAAMQFEGRYRTKELNPSLFNDKKAAQYQGELVGDNFFETYQKRRVAIKAARYEGTLKAAVAKKPQQSEGTEIGKGWSLYFYSTPSVKNYGGLARKYKPISRKQLHPSYRYSKGKVKNGKEEKEKTFKFKIWFASIFKPNEGQPKKTKSKHGRPRYDKGERDLWYE